MASNDPKNSKEVRDIFVAASKLPPGERPSFLGSVCADDTKLRREVEEMLASSDADTNPMKVPAIEAPAGRFTGGGQRLTIGQEFGQYRILAPIGKGGMGEVYLAEDSRLGRKVALKILSQVFDLDPDGLRRFIREAKIVSKLNHPNILTIYESGEEKSIKFIASEYVEGETLTERLQKGPLGVEAALDIAVQVVSALLAAHGAAIIHRDVKPDNIMIRPDGVVKLLDFGIAKLSEPLRTTGPRTAPGMIVGTPNYLSPEQARGKEVDPRSDIFSFGLVLYEMLSGAKAFEADSAIDVISAILQKEPVPLCSVAPEIPSEISDVISKTLRKHPEERYTSTADLLVELKSVRSDLALQSKGDSGSADVSVAAPVDNVQPDDLEIESDGGHGAVAVKYSLREYLSQHRRTATLAVAIVPVLFGSILLYFYWTGSTSRSQIASIAVLPFVNESGSADAEYLSDGIAESLIGSLSQVSGLDVRSRNSAFAYKGKDVGLRQIAKELKVQGILSGRVAVRGDDLTFYVELVDMATDKVIWSQTYNKPLSSLLALQTEIARDVSGNLRAKLSGADEQRLTKNAAANSEAYRLYLKGNFEWNRHTEESLQKAIDFYDQALEKDPNYALAYTGLAKTYGVLSNNYRSPNETFPKALEFAQKALMIDGSLAEAHAVKAAVHLYYQWDLDAAAKETARAFELDQNNGLAHQIEAGRLESISRFEDALAERKRAVEIDPLSSMDNYSLGATYYLKGDLDRAVEQLRQTIDMEPRFGPAYEFLGQTLEEKKMYSDAIRTYQSGLSNTEQNPRLFAFLAHAYAMSGDREQANATLRTLNEWSRRGYVSPYLFAVAHAGLGDKQEMFEALESAYKERSVYLLWLRIDPIFTPFRADPQFQELLKRIGV